MFNYFRNASATGKIIPRIFTTEQYKKTLCRLIQQQQNLPLFTFEFICTFKLFVVYEHFHTYIHTRSHTLTHTHTHMLRKIEIEREMWKSENFLLCFQLVYFFPRQWLHDVTIEFSIAVILLILFVYCRKRLLSSAWVFFAKVFDC
jgi:hypothetical protein